MRYINLFLQYGYFAMYVKTIFKSVSKEAILMQRPESYYQKQYAETSYLTKGLLEGFTGKYNTTHAILDEACGPLSFILKDLLWIKQHRVNIIT